LKALFDLDLEFVSLQKEVVGAGRKLTNRTG
jgi:hypothetical protein